MSSRELSRGAGFNESASHRNVGLVIETRPDEITRTRSAGCDIWA
jgi:histone acetyltransferase (RNA polymerase elongator complex component)